MKMSEVSFRGVSTIAPATRRTFSSAWDETLYVYDQLVFWFYAIGSTVKARH